jgi:hypothetical protein
VKNVGCEDSQSLCPSTCMEYMPLFMALLCFLHRLNLCNKEPPARRPLKQLSTFCSDDKQSTYPFPLKLAESSHVARHRNRCLRALLGGRQPLNSEQPSSAPKAAGLAVLKKQPTSRAQSITSEAGSKQRQESSFDPFEGAASSTYCGATSWLPPICWTAVGRWLKTF